MTDLDDRLIPKVKTLAEKYGKQLTFNASTTVSGATYNPATGGMNSPEPSLVVYTYYCTPPAPCKKEWPGGEQTPDGSLETLLPSSGLNATFEGTLLEPGLLVEFDDTNHVVTGIDRIYSGDQVAAYQLTMQTRSWTA